MSGIIYGSPVSSRDDNAYDSARASGLGRARDDPIVEFDSRGNILYRVPQQHSIQVEATFVARRLDTTITSVTTTGVTQAFTVQVGDSRGPFSVDFFDEGLRYLLEQHFVLSRQANPGLRTFGSDGGGIYNFRTDTHSGALHGALGWSFTIAGSTGDAASAPAGFLTVLSSAWPCEVVGWRAMTSPGAADAPLAGGAVDYIFGAGYIGNALTQQRELIGVAQGVGSFTAITCVNSGQTGPKGSVLQFIWEVKFRDATPAASVVL